MTKAFLTAGRWGSRAGEPSLRVRFIAMVLVVGLYVGALALVGLLNQLLK